MIDSLDALPGLSRCWLADIEATDPDFFAELAREQLIEPGGDDSGHDLPAGLGEVLAAFHLIGKAIGAFRFPMAMAMADAGSQAVQIADYNSMIREFSRKPAELLFVGTYAVAGVFVCDRGVGLYDAGFGRRTRQQLVAPDFTGFLLAQASASDAYKAHVVGHRDEAAYRRRQHDTAQAPRFAGIDIAAIFDAQYTG